MPCRSRGVYTVVYDAEDKPEPDQLRRALDAFHKGGNRLACVQASLTIDNTADNWLAGMFTANYAGQFDVFLRGLAALHLPFPLGGSSNHFRTAALRKPGGWDPYNVTEDADLGIRLYRLGYRATAIASTTYEEAPARFVPWIKQRNRWYKGWEKTEHGVARTSRAARSHRLPSRLRQSPEPSRQRPVNEPRKEVPVDRRRPPTAQIGPGVPIAPIKIMQTARGTPLAR